jgi:hypothetical protein
MHMTHWMMELLLSASFILAMAWPCCCPNCECCTLASTPSRAKIWLTITFDGVANGTCADCADWNTTAFIVQRDVPGDCIWLLEDDLPCGLTELNTEIVCSAPGNETLELYGWVIRIYDGLDTDGYFSTNGGVLQSTPFDCADPGAIPYFAALSDNDVCDWSGATTDVA